jgi:ADP-ribose pyrophosphatase
LKQTGNRVYEGKIIQLDIEDVGLPNGSLQQFEIVRHPGGAATVVLDDHHNICLLKQYRYAIDDWLWEIPAGKIDAGEDPETTARRELQEEAGVQADHWIPLGEMISSPGVFTEKIYLYLVQHLQHTSKAHEEHEIIEIHWIPFNDACDWAINGKINDAKTVIGLLRAREYLMMKNDNN